MPNSWIGRLSIFQIEIFPQIQQNHYQNLSWLFAETDKVILKLIWNTKDQEQPKQF